MAFAGMTRWVSPESRSFGRLVLHREADQATDYTESKQVKLWRFAQGRKMDLREAP